MPPAVHEIDLELLVREAISGVAITAYSRGIGIASHIDNRLKSRALGDVKALSDFLRRGLARTIEIGRTRRIALALWRGEADGDNEDPPILLEVCRAVDAEEMPLTGLADLWALPESSDNLPQIFNRRSDRGDALLIPLPCTPVADAPLIARKSGESFRNRSMLVVRDVLFDLERTAASLAVLGLDVTFSMSVEQAIEIAQADARSGRPCDFLVLDIDLLGDGAVSLAQQFRADPALAEARILLAGVGPELDQPSCRSGLFDAVFGPPVPWRQLMDAVRDLARGSTKTSGPLTVESRTGSAIPSLAGRRVLIAEDVATNQMLLQAVLAPTGAAVEAVPDGRALLKRHGLVPADVILMDLQMPGMGGIAAMRRLRAMGGTAGAVPVVALTAYARNADRKLALEAGMDAYLAKPIVVSELYDLLRQLLPEDGRGAG